MNRDEVSTIRDSMGPRNGVSIIRDSGWVILRPAFELFEKRVSRFNVSE